MSSYKDNGLTWKSNLVTKNSRDDSGNITLREGDIPDNNPDVYIDPVISTFTVENFINLVNTRFSYFKFPTTSVSNATELDYDTELAFEAFDEASFITDVITQERELLTPYDQAETYNNTNIFAVSTIRPNDWPARGWNADTIQKVREAEEWNWYYEWVQYQVYNAVPFARLDTSGAKVGSPTAEFTITDSMRQQLKDLDNAVNDKLQEVYTGTDRNGQSVYVKPKIRHAIKLKCRLTFENANNYASPQRNQMISGLAADSFKRTPNDNPPINGFNEIYKYGNNYYFVDFGLKGWYTPERGYNMRTTNGGYNPGSRMTLITTNGKYKVRPRTTNNDIQNGVITSKTFTKLNELIPSQLLKDTFNGDFNKLLPDQVSNITFNMLYDILWLSVEFFEQDLMNDILNVENNAAFRYNSEMGEWKNPGDFAYKAIDKLNELLYRTDTRDEIRKHVGWDIHAQGVLQRIYRKKEAGINETSDSFFDLRGGVALNATQQIPYLSFNKTTTSKSYLSALWNSNDKFVQTRILYQIYLWLTLLGVKRLTRDTSASKVIYENGKPVILHRIQQTTISEKTDDNVTINDFITNGKYSDYNPLWVDSVFRKWFYQNNQTTNAYTLTNINVNDIIDKLRASSETRQLSLKNTLDTYNNLVIIADQSQITQGIRNEFGDYEFLSRFNSFDYQGNGANISFEYVISPDLLDMIEFNSNEMDNPSYVINVASVLPSYITSAKLDCEVVQVPAYAPLSAPEYREKLNSGDNSKTIIPLPKEFKPKNINIFKYANRSQVQINEQTISDIDTKYYGSYEFADQTIQPYYTGLVNVSNNVLLTIDPLAERTYIPIGAVTNNKFSYSTIDYSPLSKTWLVDGIPVSSSVDIDQKTNNKGCFRFDPLNRWSIVFAQMILQTENFTQNIFFDGANAGASFDEKKLYNLTTTKSIIKDEINNFKSMIQKNIDNIQVKPKDTK